MIMTRNRIRSDNEYLMRAARGEADVIFKVVLSRSSSALSVTVKRDTREKKKLIKRGVITPICRAI